MFLKLKQNKTKAVELGRERGEKEVLGHHSFIKIWKSRIVLFFPPWFNSQSIRNQNNLSFPIPNEGPSGSPGWAFSSYHLLLVSWHLKWEHKT